MKVLDRNGREIKVGDRVKVLGEQVRQFLWDNYEDDLDEEIYRQCVDQIGMATLNSDEEFVLVDNHGVIIYSLDTCFDGMPDPCLQMVADTL